MNVISMMREINLVANPVIRESALPYLPFTPDDCAKFVRVSSFDQLDRPLDCHVQGRSQQEMNVVWHHDKHVQFIPALAAMPIERLQKHPNVRFDDEQPAAVPCREGHEITSRRRDESSRLQEQTSAAEGRAPVWSLNWHEWNSCPSRLFFTPRLSFWERPHG